MKKPAKRSKKPKTKPVKKRGSKKAKKPDSPETGSEKPESGGLIDQPRPGKLPKKAPKAAKKPNKGGRPPGAKDKQPRQQRLSPDEVKKKEELPPGPDGPPPPDPAETERPKTPEEIKARSGARLVCGLECAACKTALPPAVPDADRALLEETWYEYLLSEGGEIPPWLGLAISHAYIFGPRAWDAWKRKKAKEK